MYKWKLYWIQFWDIFLPVCLLPGKKINEGKCRNLNENKIWNSIDELTFFFVRSYSQFFFSCSIHFLLLLFPFHYLCISGFFFPHFSSFFGWVCMFCFYGTDERTYETGEKNTAEKNIVCKWKWGTTICYMFGKCAT